MIRCLFVFDQADAQKNEIVLDVVVYDAKAQQAAVIAKANDRLRRAEGWLLKESYKEVISIKLKEIWIVLIYLLLVLSVLLVGCLRLLEQRSCLALLSFGDRSGRDLGLTLTRGGRDGGAGSALGGLLGGGLSGLPLHLLDVLAVR